MRRKHLRGRVKIQKRRVVHGSAFHLTLVLRSLFKMGTPRGCQGRKSPVFSIFCAWLATLAALVDKSSSFCNPQTALRDDKGVTRYEPILLAA